MSSLHQSFFYLVLNFLHTSDLILFHFTFYKAKQLFQLPRSSRILAGEKALFHCLHDLVRGVDLLLPGSFDNLFNCHIILVSFPKAYDALCQNFHIIQYIIKGSCLIKVHHDHT